jgi:hypothetical protein
MTRIPRPLMMRREIERGTRKMLDGDSLVPIEFLFFLERYMGFEGC